MLNRRCEIAKRGSQEVQNGFVRSRNSASSSKSSVSKHCRIAFPARMLNLVPSILFAKFGGTSSSNQMSILRSASRRTRSSSINFLSCLMRFSLFLSLCCVLGDVFGAGFSGERGRGNEGRRGLSEPRRCEDIFLLSQKHSRLAIFSCKENGNLSNAHFHDFETHPT